MLDERSLSGNWITTPNVRTLRSDIERLKNSLSSGCSPAENKPSTRKNRKTNHAMISDTHLDGEWGHVTLPPSQRCA